jgi:hypothetical protein
VTDRQLTKALIAAGSLGGAAIYATAYALAPTTTAEPIRLALWLAAFPALVVYAMFFGCLRMRDSSPAAATDPLAGSESERWKVNQRVLSNTVEQCAIFVPITLALATRLDAAHAQILPIATVCWTASRIAFWIGYRRGAVWRAPGMAWTHSTTAITIASLIYFTAR